MLFVGPLEGVHDPPWHPANDWTIATPHWPNLAWPDDRAWVTATDIDLESMYVAGSEALIEALTTNDELEVVRASPDDPS